MIYKIKIPKCNAFAWHITNLIFIQSPLERGMGCVIGCAIPDTPLPLSGGEYIKFNVVMQYCKTLPLYIPAYTDT